MIHVFHGFLGSPQDFSFLKNLGKVQLHDLYHENLDDIELNLRADDTLLGYSMGGRIALELAAKRSFEIKKVVLINSHPGIPSEMERKARKSFEEEILSHLKSKSPEEFLNYWNALPIFSADKPLVSLAPEKMEASLGLFDQFRLSKQKDFLPMLKEHQEKVLWIVGKLDEKYFRISQEMLLPNGIPCRFMTGGHRLFQREQELLTVLKEEHIL